LYHRGVYWNFPKGKIEAGESEETGALRELEEETGITDIKLIKGWKQETDFFFKEKRNGKNVLIKKKFTMFMAPFSPTGEVKISIKHNGYAWMDFESAKKSLRFKNLKAIISEVNSYVEAKIKEAKKQKNNS
jgi:8-oxo-dGTP pyrophosphatase MutT (NUDIX family)